MDWIDLAQDRDRWHALVNAGNFLRICQLLRKDSAACSCLLHIKLVVAQLVDALHHKPGDRGFD
jgi:hypothetical protein